MQNESTVKLPVKTENCNITNVPFTLLKNMFLEAEKLLGDNTNIVLQPGSRNVYIVANSQKASDPYVVKYTASTSTVNCSKKCHRFCSFHICEHTLATAYCKGILDGYLKNYMKKNMNRCNITDMANATMPASRGKKPSKKERPSP